MHNVLMNILISRVPLLSQFFQGQAICPHDPNIICFDKLHSPDMDCRLTTQCRGNELMAKVSGADHVFLIATSR